MTETIITRRCVCDRCGREFPEKEYRVVIFEHRDDRTVYRAAAKGDVCPECYKDFCDLAESFFDELNKATPEEATT